MVVLSSFGLQSSFCYFYSLRLYFVAKLEATNGINPLDHICFQDFNGIVLYKVLHLNSASFYVCVYLFVCSSMKKKLKNKNPPA